MPARTLSRRHWIAGLAAAGLGPPALAGAYAWRVEPHWVRVCYRRMPLAGLPALLVGKRLIQISDLHVGPIVDDAYLRGVLRSLPELEPDWLVITGDFMTSRTDEEVGATLATLGELGPLLPSTFAVLGNHDYGRNFREAWVAANLREGLRGIGVRVLSNESLEAGGLQIGGADDLWAGACDVRRTLAGIDPERPAVVLAHNPDTVDLPGWDRYRGWVLSGHTHGGQCRLPLLGAPVLPIRNHRYHWGHVRLSGGRDLYVNPGLGYKRRVRFGVRPEVTVFTLTPRDAGGAS